MLGERRFWVGRPGNAGELRAMHRAGVFGFKCFLVPSECRNLSMFRTGSSIAMPKLVDSARHFSFTLNSLDRLKSA